MSDGMRKNRLWEFIRVKFDAIKESGSMIASVSALALGGLTLLLYALSIRQLPEFTWNDLTGTVLAVCVTGVIVVTTFVGYCLLTGYYARWALESVYPEAKSDVLTGPQPPLAPYARITRIFFILGVTCFSALVWLGISIGLGPQRLISPYTQHLTLALLIALVTLAILLVLDWQRFRRQWGRYTLLSIFGGAMATLCVTLVAWYVAPDKLIVNVSAKSTESAANIDWSSYSVIALDHAVAIGFAITVGIADLRDVPDSLLNERQLRVKEHTLSGTVFFDRSGAVAALSQHRLPAYFLDFETIQFAVPVWKGTRPYQQIPFQFSVHRLSRTGKLEHQGFLDLSGKDPSKAFAENLILACGDRGPVFVYNAAFENARIRDLAQRYPRLKQALLAITGRVVDLLPVAEQYFYHAEQQGSWSIKKVLPAVVPDLRYDALEGVQDGGMAMDAYREAIHGDTSSLRKAQIEEQLIRYCALDTYAMVRLWQFFSGRSELKL